MRKFFSLFLTSAALLHMQFQYADDVMGCWDGIQRNCCRSPVSICCPPACGKFFVTAEYLYWKAYEDGLSYAITGLGTFGGHSPDSQGKVQDVDWDYHSGFRLGGGYALPCVCWDVYANYTHYSGDADGVTVVPGTGAESSLWVTFGPPSTGSATLAPIASAEWDLCFHTVDIEIGRCFCWQNCFILRPFGGIKVAWTKDKYDIEYSSPPDNFLQTIDHRQTFCSVGPRMGISSNWNLCNCLSFFADGAASVVWGRYCVTREDALGIIDPTTTVDTKHKFYTLRPLLDCKLGVKFDFPQLCRLHMYATVAYETIVFFNHNQFLKFVDSGNLKGVFFPIDSNLQLHGLTFALGASF